jgi:hypothetical protein
LCRAKQKRLSAEKVAGECSPENCEHLRLKYKEGKICRKNVGSQTQIITLEKQEKWECVFKRREWLKPKKEDNDGRTSLRS